MSQELPFTMQIRNTANVTLDTIISGLIANTSTAYNQANTATTSAAAAAAAAAAAQTTANQGVTIGEAAYAEANAGYSLATTAENNALSANVVAKSAYATANIGVSASGVSPGSYGGALAIPVITFDVRGRATVATTVTPAQFTTTGPGIVPASPGGTTDFLRADGTWAGLFAAAALGVNGYYRFNNGLLLQWGATNADRTTLFNTPFATLFSLVLTGLAPVSQQPTFSHIVSQSATSFVSSSSNQSSPVVNWIALGV